MFIDSDIFSKRFSKDLLRESTIMIKEKKFSPQEVIVEEGELNNNIYFIEKGEVALTYK